MKKKINSSLTFGMALFINTLSAQAASVDLYDWAFNVDSDISYYGDPMPTTGSLDSSGLGTLSISFSDAGSHSFISFFDFEVDEPLNSNFNEYGYASGSPAAGQSWEIDEPGYVFGDIFTNMEAGVLDNTNNVPAGWEDDVSFAMGWDFDLLAGETAVIDLFLSDTLDTTGFYLAHVDPDSDISIYLWSTIDIQGPASVPAPGTLVLLGAGLVGLSALRRRKQ